MSAFSTISLTKSTARKYLLTQIMKATDDELADMLDVYLAERRYNARVVEDSAANDDYILD